MTSIRQLRARLARLFDRRTVLVFCGDSHILLAKRAYKAGLFGGRRMLFVKVGGATAAGLRYPNTRKRALAKFREALLPFNPKYQPVFQIGAMDCEYFILQRAQRLGLTVSSQVDRSLASYEVFLREVVTAGYRNAIVTSALLPAIADRQEGPVPALRRNVTASLRERTETFLQFNGRLQALAARLGLNFIDLNQDLLNPDTQTIRDEYRHDDPNDHHLHPDRGASVWAAQLRAVA